MRQRSTFGVEPATQVNVGTEEQKEVTKQWAIEYGAAWSSQSKNNEEFLKIKLNVPKTEIQKALAESTGDTVALSFVSFVNKNQNGNPARPKYRIYPDKKK